MAPLSTDDGNSETKASSFADLFEQQGPLRRTKELRVGDRVDAVIVQVGRDSVFVEVDGKQQAFLEASELRAPDGTETVKVGERITAHVVSVDEQSGQVRLGRSLTASGGRGGGAAMLSQAKAAGLPVEGKVVAINKGGAEVEVAGTRAFCPMSQLDRGFTREPQELVGKTLSFLVTEVREAGPRTQVVLSRRALLEREAFESAAKVLERLAVGAVVRGTVTGVRDFGAFVDLGGVEGLIPGSEVSYDRSRKVSDVLKPGDAVDVLVRERRDGEAGKPPKITLSLKALAANPWEGLQLEVGSVVAGTVARVADFGVFVRLSAGVEGLLHASTLASPAKQAAALSAMGEGEPVMVVVQAFDPVQKRISLVPAPEGAAAGARVQEAALSIGSVVVGTVERHETYGIFVQMKGTRGRAGRGLVPAAELGVPRGTDLRRAFPEGTEVKTKVLETGDGRLRLSIKGALDAEERAQFEAARSTGQAAAPRSLGTLGDLLRARR